MGGVALAVILFVQFLGCPRAASVPLESVTPSRPLRDGDTLVSASGAFELGFFSPQDSEGRYLGIWYKNISPQTIVWVANRESPLSNSFGVVNVTSLGILVLMNSNYDVVWASNSAHAAPANPVAVLMDSGNLVVRKRRNDSNSSENIILWQSFDYLGDTLLPGMKLGFELGNRLDRFLTSWKSKEDPSPGQFSMRMDTHGYPQLVIEDGNGTIYFRAGSWSGLRFNDNLGLNANSLFMSVFVFNYNEVYYKYEMENISSPARYNLDPSGSLLRIVWIERIQGWAVFSTLPMDMCDRYGSCGANAICGVNFPPLCQCLDGFVPKFLAEWRLGNWSNGCIRRTPLNCSIWDGSPKYGFRRFRGMKLPDTSSCWYDERVSLEGCEELCLRNCSCTAYAHLDAGKLETMDLFQSQRGGSGCLHWFEDLIDIRTYTVGGEDIYIKMADSELGIYGRKGARTKGQEAIIASSVIFAVILVMGAIIFLCVRNRRKHAKDTRCTEKDIYSASEGEAEMLLPVFDFMTVAHATNNFSSDKKIGEGGFGPVYKGTLIDGKEIAVKKLSKCSSQGLNELKNEVILIAKLQHRNLVKLLGFCIHKDERILVYEYMPNKSLDFFIFDSTRSHLLDWNRRFLIICGIARGLLYLHQDSRSRIIHRDLKISNILLDDEMCPKISDFGLARTFGGDQTEANTNRIVGTYGYMSPEYAMDGHFSVKSDVFSFGVMMLEIISGKKNRGFCHPDHRLLNLLGYTWMLWMRGTPLQLLDDNLAESCNICQVSRCIQVALLCVQQRSEDRPDMSSVVFMLGSDNPLSQPKQPGFYMQSNPPEAQSLETRNEVYTVNEASISLLDPR